MPTPDTHPEPVRFNLPVPVELRFGGILLIAVYMGVDLLVFAGIGLDRYHEQLLYHPSHVFVPLLGEFLPPLFFLFPPRRILARLELAPDRIRHIPDIRAAFFGQTGDELIIPADATEILLCQTFSPGTLPGYRIIARTADGTEHSMGSRTSYTRIRLTSRGVKRLADALSAITRLPLRAIIRRKLRDGTIEESPWTPTRSVLRNYLLSVFIYAAIPFVGAAVMGWISPGYGIVAISGLALWLVQMLILFTIARAGHKNFSAPQAAMTLVTFGATYSVIFLFAQYLTHPG